MTIDSEPQPTTLSRSSDHLGTLATTLRDLIGPTTVLHELTQNADDAPDATYIEFDVTDDALTVRNDGTFTDCGAQRDRECPWLGSGSRACDLHSFRTVAGRNKTGDSGTTGAFGVGFTSVYQVTDHPELLTGEWHLTLDETAPEDHRIDVCGSSGCSRPHNAPGTTFILPWQRQASQLRHALGVPPIAENDIDDLERAILHEAEAVLLFLKRVRRISVRTRNVSRDFTRTEGAFGPIISSGTSSSRWLTLTTHFADQAATIIDRAGDLIAPDRAPEVTIAIPMDNQSLRGVLYAGLPTESRSGVPAHINATFFPHTDRKSVRFDGGPESRWNRSALEAAARCLSENLVVLRDRVGVERVWQILKEITETRRSVAAGDLDDAFSCFADRMRETVPDVPLVETVAGDFVCPSDALLPQEVETYKGVEAFIALDLPIVSRSLHPLVHSVPYSENYKIRALTIAVLADRLREGGLTVPRPSDNEVLNGDGNDSLLEALTAMAERQSLEPIAEVAVIPCTNGQIAPARMVFRAADDTEGTLFDRLVDDFLLVDAERVTELCPKLLSLCDPITVDAAATLLAGAPAVSLGELSGELLAWLDDHSGEIHSGNRAAVAALPLFPSADGTFRALTALSLRSGFQDPLGIAELVDEDAVAGHRDLLHKLGARDLDVIDYLRRHVVPAAETGGLAPEQAAVVLDIISANRSAVEAAHGLSEQLCHLPLIQCTDGRLRPAVTVYLPSPVIRNIAPDAPMAIVEGVTAHALDTMAWLGVTATPRSETIAEAVHRIAQGLLPTQAGEYVLRAVDDIHTPPKPLPAELQPLRTEPWLPVAGGGRERPSSAYPTNQRHLYGEQGAELALPANVQTSLFAVLTSIGMPSQPTTAMIAAHLRHCSTTATPVNEQVYEFLNRAADDPAVRSLRDVPCIQLAPGNFALPRAVFWSEVRLGNRAHQLPSSRRSQQPFFTAVGVKETPGARELQAIIEAIADDTGTDEITSEDESILLECWRLLGALPPSAERDAVLVELGQRRSMIDGRRVLAQPSRLYFRDGQGFSDRFRLLSHDIIRRDKNTWRALEIAGVGRAEDLIEVVLHHADPKPDPGFHRLLIDRRAAFLRVLEGVTDFQDEPVSFDSIAELNIRHTDLLQVAYRAKLYTQEETIDPVQVDAIYLPAEHCLLHRRGGTPRARARELARALDRDGETAFLSMAIEHIITAPTLGDAQAALDEYGVPDLEDVDRETQPSRTVGDGYPEEPAPAPRESADSRPEVVGQPRERDVHGGHREARQGPRVILPRTQPSMEHLPRSRSAAEDPRPQTQTRLRSYVSRSDDQGNPLQEDEAPGRISVDIAGVTRVMEHERAAGRLPQEMAHDNPGFDIESCDESGQVVRRIEVKSTGSAWSTRGVMLSRRQHEQAVEDGDLFWLYVVENAESDQKAAIYRIQNPARRIDYFGFDDGWKDAAEPGS